MSRTVEGLVLAGGSGGVDEEAVEELVDKQVAPLDADPRLTANSASRGVSQDAIQDYTSLIAVGDAMFPLVMPPGYVVNNFIPGEKVPFLARVRAPKAGLLKDLMVFTKTKAGNVAMGIYDTGDAEAGKRTRLFQSGSVTVAAAAAWQVVSAAPNVPVVAGQQLDLLVVCDSAAVELGKVAVTSAAALALPANYLKAAGGASPKLQGTIAGIAGIAELPATIAEASIAQTVNVPTIACRVE